MEPDVILTRSFSELTVSRSLRHSTDGFGKPLNAQAMVAVVPYKRSRSVGSIVNLGAAVERGRGRKRRREGRGRKRRREGRGRGRRGEEGDLVITAKFCIC